MKAEDVVMKCPNCGATMQQYKGKYKCQYCEAVVSVKMPAKKKKKFSISAAYDVVKRLIGDMFSGIGYLLAFAYLAALIYGMFMLTKLIVEHL